jgi:hypothetical protein
MVDVAAEHAIIMGEKVIITLFGKSEGKKPLDRYRCKVE